MKIVILDCHAVNPGDLSWEPIKEIAECVIYERTSLIVHLRELIESINLIISLQFITLLLRKSINLMQCNGVEWNRI